MDKPQRLAQREDSSVDAQKTSRNSWDLEWYCFQISHPQHIYKPRGKKSTRNPKWFASTCLTLCRIGIQSINETYRKIKLHKSHTWVCEIGICYIYLTDKKCEGWRGCLTPESQCLSSSLISAVVTTLGEPKVGPAELGVREIPPRADLGSKA